MASTSSARRFAGRVAVVTGGGRNIGRAVAQRLAAEGASVVVAGRTRERLDETAAAITAAGGRALAVPCDVTVLAEVEAVVARAEAAFGPVDCVAALAGGGGEGAIDAIDAGLWARIVQVNLVGTFHAARAVLPGMRERGRGTIATCCGGGAWFPAVGQELTAYAAAKAGLCRFTDQLAVELLGTGIRVNCLQPGQVLDEDALRDLAAEEARTGVQGQRRAGNHAPADAAELTAWLLADESAPLTGRIVAVGEDWWRDPRRVLEVAANEHLACLRRVHP